MKLYLVLERHPLLHLSGGGSSGPVGAPYFFWTREAAQAAAEQTRNGGQVHGVDTTLVAECPPKPDPFALRGVVRFEEPAMDDPPARSAEPA